MVPEIIDVHLHCFVGQQHGEVVARDLALLRREGVARLTVAGMVTTDQDRDIIWNLVPDYVDNQGDPCFNEADDLLALAARSGEMLLPLVDTRYIRGDVATTLDGFVRQGFRGIKGIYLPDNENDLGVGNVPETLGISLEQYRRREWELFAYAEEHDLPLLYHMDARRYGDTMKALLDDFPRVRVNFPHLGIGRKAFCAFLDRYPNVFTDVANLLPHIRNNPASYRDFIMHYPDRVCFGSDAFLYQAGMVLDYISMVKELGLPEEIEAQVFCDNPVRFLGRALEGV
ncbi:amidohydrolase family protein [Geobacter pickeringii]|uniref:Amidohydrolase n=1 Tax=Geobacter pickeringii TaxID=345632 RepID=A0A0B5BAB1_9BACT|nr:amidohydrolase family protein [Geobacter pickeringii]AJE03522.1 amidohydrolase [Geobacter pickeringii]